MQQYSVGAQEISEARAWETFGEPANCKAFESGGQPFGSIGEVYVFPCWGGRSFDSPAKLRQYELQFNNYFGQSII